MTSVRVLLADDHALVRAGVRALLANMPEVQVVAEVSTGPDALQAIAEQQPEVVLMNVSMSGLNGIEAAGRIASEHPRTRVLIMSQHKDEEYVRRALIVGAAGYLLKDADRAELELAVRAVARGDTWLSPSVSRALIGMVKDAGRVARSPLDVLTPRQREVLQLIGEGHATKGIASRLSLSTKTVETHRMQIMQRLNVKGVPALVRAAIRLGLTSDTV